MPAFRVFKVSPATQDVLGPICYLFVATTVKVDNSQIITSIFIGNPSIMNNIPSRSDHARHTLILCVHFVYKWKSLEISIYF